MRPIMNIAIDAIRKAGNIISKSSFYLSHSRIKNKEFSIDYANQVELLSENKILHILKKIYPDHCFLSEESGEIKGKDKRHKWVIDPLDGTYNFIHGFPYYGISIAKLFRDIPEYGIIYNPITEELYTASSGEPSLCNGKRICIKKTKRLQGCLYTTSINRSNLNIDLQLSLLKSLYNKKAIFRHSGSTALDLAYISSGTIDFMWSFNAPIWDIAAGSIILQESGGSIMDIYGENFLKSGNFVASSDPNLTKEIVQMLQKKI